MRTEPRNTSRIACDVLSRYFNNAR